mmetsp:Transcript_21057/g.32136  ORF Transcript_21057/g.32136 Transcript_21057/m.32136 type:complete len:311 (+) Transcript_21057:71-1003(+)|eukprot:CAMPEP_0196807668 /NCGR_PEP_ID=MMETSP1362-20130617/7667_1 /TAXON_ID=163516 /ORGANISM="Leptocylindrus danicus, Strain CCMP1856" /LENGTH=310 /DNA_ID=CAMNT_0042181685 /DNA_START=59 /DNA_END=991 /DNA_ORIENTATION=-
MPEILIKALGALTFINLSLKFLSQFYKTFLRPGKNLRKLGQWAVVTGATDGIGKAYSFAFAKKGMSIVLISRTEAKLQAVAKEITDKYSGVEVKYVVCDYSNFDEAARKKVADAISGLEVGVLVNNVGVSYSFPKFFHELSDQDVANLMEMNVNSTTWMTRMVIGGMVERKSGAIVNIASASGLYTMPLLAEYSAAKAYIEKFSRGLNAEYSKKGITVQCQAPFYVATKLAKMRKSFTCPTPDSFVADAIKWVGYPDAVVSPVWLHNIQGWVLDIVPDFLTDPQVMNMHMAVRKKGMKKEAMKAEAKKAE